MGGLTVALLLALGAAALALSALYVSLRVRLRRLSAQMEDFLSRDGEALAFSVREDSLAPLHNAAAELQNQLLLARERHAEECRRTADLTADISHQLKTPLASLRLFCELDEGAHMAEQLGQIERMERLIGALLRLERLCADGYRFTFSEHDAASIVRDAWSELEGLYPARALSVSGDGRLRCDERWLREAFLNLLKNACEHTKPGGRIFVRVEAEPSALLCTVRDEGGGVRPEALSRLFERFYSADGDGAGLGLAIVREIIRRHHGDIRAENVAGGLQMRIRIPIMNLAKS